MALAAPSFAAGGISSTQPNYPQLRAEFATPDHARWGEVPIWWWNGEPIRKDRLTWQLEALASQGVKAVCPIQLSENCSPRFFSPEWWELFQHVHKECKRLGMSLWLYDQVGYGDYGWFDKALEKVKGGTPTFRLALRQAEGSDGKPVDLEIPEGQLLDLRAYPVIEGVAQDDKSVSLKDKTSSRTLKWRPPSGKWQVTAVVAIPEANFYLNPLAADAFIDLFYGEVERRLGREAMGKSFVGFFQDEHPFLSRDNDDLEKTIRGYGIADNASKIKRNELKGYAYSEDFGRRFGERFGYPLARAVPALFFDVGPRTPKYRTDFYDLYLECCEEAYWKKVFDWTQKRGLLTAYDNLGREVFLKAPLAYIDYFRTQRAFSAPGSDDFVRWDEGNPRQYYRNYYDSRIASSIGHLYQRPRVWLEAFHSTGWGRTPGETLAWLSTGLAYGANIYNEHGLYYTTRGSTWAWAAPDPHFRQPYWVHYRQISDWVTRLSCAMSRGVHQADVAVHYPIVGFLAGDRPKPKPAFARPDVPADMLFKRGRFFDLFMRASQTLYDAGMDNDIADDDSIRAGQIRDGRLFMGDAGYQALVFPPEAIMRRAILEKALAFAEAGGKVLFLGTLPEASTEGGWQDPELNSLLRRLLGDFPNALPSSKLVEKKFPSGGYCAVLPADRWESALTETLSVQMDRDFTFSGGRVFYTHRRIADADVYLVQNKEVKPITLKASFRGDGVPEVWDPTTGRVLPVDRFARRQKRTELEQQLESDTAILFVLRAGAEQWGENKDRLQAASAQRTLPSQWKFSVIPTRDNRWGDFYWPPSDEKIGPEIRSFRYREETGEAGEKLGWHQASFADADWPVVRAGTGPYWLCAGPLPKAAGPGVGMLKRQAEIKEGAAMELNGRPFKWQPVSFSKKFSSGDAHGGGDPYKPKKGLFGNGTIDPYFIKFPEGRKLLFTRIRSPQDQQLGLRVELDSSTWRLWVNGEEQFMSGSVGNLPLRQGENTVLLDIPDGRLGRIFAEKTLPKSKGKTPSKTRLVRGVIPQATPYLECFNQVPDLIYDVKPQSAVATVSWCRFHAPPGLSRLTLPTRAAAKVWVNGKPAEVRGQVAEVASPPEEVSNVAIRLELPGGDYGGAVFSMPLRVEVSGTGSIGLGRWENFGLATYSGVGVYRQDLSLTAEEVGRRTELDLGQVNVSAEVLLNGRSAGIRVAAPFRFDLTGLLRLGENALEVRVANTLAPHYTITFWPNSPTNTSSGLAGPVVLRQWGKP
jgi:hypothetical protein